MVPRAETERTWRPITPSSRRVCWCWARSRYWAEGAGGRSLCVCSCMCVQVAGDTIVPVCSGWALGRSMGVGPGPSTLGNCSRPLFGMGSPVPLLAMNNLVPVKRFISHWAPAGREVRGRKSSLPFLLECLPADRVFERGLPWLPVTLSDPLLVIPQGDWLCEGWYLKSPRGRLVSRVSWYQFLP